MIVKLALVISDESREAAFIKTRPHLDLTGANND